MPFEPHDTTPPIPGHPTRATLVALVDGRPHLRLGSRPGQLVVAQSVVQLGPEALGREVVVQLIDGDPEQPVIFGVLAKTPTPDKPTVALEADDLAVELQAEQRITLRCGKASITLTAEGRIVIKGTQIFSQATGSHRIRGGSIQLN